jgi:hypothetical protein
MIGKDRTIQILIAINILFLVLVLTGMLFSPQRAHDRSTTIRVLTVSPENVTRLVIDGTELLDFQKQADTWTLSVDGRALPVDQARMAAFLAVLSAIERMETVAKDRSAWESLGLSDTAAAIVEWFDNAGRSLGSLRVGKPDSIGRVSYLVVGGSDRVYAGPVAVSSYTQASRRSWLDLRIWAASRDPAEIQHIAVQGQLELADGVIQEMDYRLSRSGSTWTADGLVDRLDGQKVDTMVRSLLGMRAEDYLGPGDSPGDDGVQVSLMLGNGNRLDLTVGSRQSDGRYKARSSQREQAIAVSAWTVRDAIKPLTDLMVVPGQ